ncbi:UDP-N-acetylmuramyl-tripeptide synthetase [Candidatus Giovannonibacteria bacterium]|nr:UDP-N-acetylmuramyl-tripeptide synthetase [Candidatus Giovannonibacteria bacterium]
MLDAIKKWKVFELVYKLPGLVWFYHFLLALLGVLIYGRPDKKLFIIGITGTKGKTTTLELLNSTLEQAGKKTALLSSLRVKIGETSEKNRLGNTMPGRAYIRKFLKKAVRAGCTYALVEVTSQGVVCSRHRFISWNVGVLTNLAPEHIESHGSFENYRNAKLSFLEYVLRGKGKVFINRDDKNSEFFTEKLRGFGTETYSRNDPSTRNLLSSADGHNPFLSSDFNQDNAASAIVVARDLGIDEEPIKEALRGFGGVPGRMEFVAREPFSVVVDYAHTPDSLKKVYTFLREQVAKSKGQSEIGSSPSALGSKLICVLGAAGGGRDKWKRSVMGKIAAGYCDEVILTNEDPYDEKPEDIVEELARGFEELKPPSQLFKIIDRREAIAKAISLAQEGDTVVITGKGSEDFIHVAGGKKVPWNDRRVAEEILAERKEREEF